jgi:voltage-gated potassium channel
MLQNYFQPQSCAGIDGNNIPDMYYPFSYFRITLAPLVLAILRPYNARLLAAFWGIVGQFYMVGIVGIIISKFTIRIYFIKKPAFLLRKAG